jgi:hypothetical protein
MNLGQIRTDVQAHGYGVDTAAFQTAFINSTYRWVHGKLRWPFLETQDTTLNTVAGTSSYALPMTAWRNLDAVRLQNVAVQQYVNLEYKPPQDFRDFENMDRDMSTPCYWTMYASQVHFWPVPDGVYNVVIDYIIEPPDLVADIDVPVLPLPYHDILTWGAIEKMAYRERDWLGRQFAQTEKMALMTVMEEEYLLRQRQSGSHVKKSGFYETGYPYPFSMIGF